MQGRTKNIPATKCTLWLFTKSNGEFPKYNENSLHHPFSLQLFFYLERSWQIVYLHFDLPLLNIKTGNCHKLNAGNDDLDVDHYKSGEKVKSVPYLCAVAVIGIPLT